MPAVHEIEAVAMAIRSQFVIRSRSAKPWEDIPEEQRVTWRAEARAAIAALDRVRAGR
jgi:hypothetical protein